MAKRLRATPSASIFNAIRATLPDTFKSRIPEATAQNIADVGVMLTSQEFEVEFNQWQKQLVNRIGLVIYHDYTLKNPLAKYIYGTMAFGDAIEEIAVDIVKGRAMDYGQEGQSLDPFIKMSNEAQAIYHKIHEPIQYGTTIEKDRIKRAFTEANGMTRLIGYFTNKLYSSANYDTWLLTKSVMAYYVNDNKTELPLTEFQKITVADVVDKETAEDWLLTMRNSLSALSFPNNKFNPMQIHKTLDNRDVVLFVQYEIMNTIGIKALANAFNIEQLNLNVRIEQMDDFGVDLLGGTTTDVAAVLAEDWWLLITQQFEEMEAIYNPRPRHWNYYLTRQMSFAVSYFKDCIIFRKSWDEVNAKMDSLRGFTRTGDIENGVTVTTPDNTYTIEYRPDGRVSVITLQQ